MKNLHLFLPQFWGFDETLRIVLKYYLNPVSNVHLGIRKATLVEIEMY